MGGYPDLFAPSDGWEEWEEKAKQALSRLTSPARTEGLMWTCPKCGSTKAEQIPPFHYCHVTGHHEQMSRVVAHSPQHETKIHHVPTCPCPICTEARKPPQQVKPTDIAGDHTGMHWDGLAGTWRPDTDSADVSWENKIAHPPQQGETPKSMMGKREYEGADPKEMP
jgi:hypothetical protein